MAKIRFNPGWNITCDTKTSSLYPEKTVTNNSLSFTGKSQ